MAAPTTMSALLASLTQSLSLAQELTPRIAGIEHPKDGISLLDVKNELLLSYLQNLVFLILLKLRNAKSTSKSTGGEQDDLDESVRSKLVELRLYLERGARPLEENLRFSIERFLRTAEDAQRQQRAVEQGLNNSKAENSDSDFESDEDEDEGASAGPTASHSKMGGKSAAPNFNTLIDDVTARSAQRDGAPTGAYRPPRRERQVMDSTTTQRRDKNERRPQKSHTMEEFVQSELSAAPLVEPSIGTTILDGGRKTKTADQRKEETERRDYEEMNFVRLPAESKKERAKKNKQAARSSGMEFGGEEWRNLGEGVDRIDRLTKTKGGKGAGVRALLDKSRKRGVDTTDGPRGSGHMDMGERFRKKVKMQEGGRRDRGKNR